MTYYDSETVTKVRGIDLLTYLRQCEPYELIQFSGDTYCTRTHDSLKISNGKWYWWSQNIGGCSALDYLIKVNGLPFSDAMKQLVDMAPIPQKNIVQEPKQRKLHLPQKHSSNREVIDYLRKRGVHPEIIEYCIENDILYQGVNRSKSGRLFFNAVFVGKDENGSARYAMQRGIDDNNRFIGDVPGSDKRYAFSIPATGASNKLHLFESAIDLLSYASRQRLLGTPWNNAHLLSLSGVYRLRGANETQPLPKALAQYLERYDMITNVALHLDNDDAGRAASEALCNILAAKHLWVADDPPPIGKDYNDYLQHYIQEARSRRKPEAPCR